MKRLLLISLSSLLLLPLLIGGCKKEEEGYGGEVRKAPGGVAPAAGSKPRAATPSTE